MEISEILILLALDGLHKGRVTLNFSHQSADQSRMDEMTFCDFVI